MPFMKPHPLPLLLALALTVTVHAQTIKRDIPYVNNEEKRQTLDIYAPADAKNLPVVFWIHGGGWVTGDKSDVALKPQAFNDKGFVFVSINYRLLPVVEMETINKDIAKAFRWVQDHIADYGGDPKRVLVGGHSAGAQLAALLCTDDRLLKAEGDEAITWLDRTLAADAKYCYAYFQKAKMLDAKGDSAAAVAVLKEGIQAAQRAGDGHAAEEMMGLMETIGG